MNTILLTRNPPETSFALSQLTQQQISCIKGVVLSEKRYGLKRLTAWQIIKQTLKKCGVRYTLYMLCDSYLTKLTPTYKKQEILKKLQALDVPILPAIDVNDDKVNDFIKSFAPDFILSIYFDQMIGEETGSIAKVATINMHPSLLPKYRGRNPNFWALYNQDTCAGVTLHHANQRLDAGGIIAQKEVLVEPGDDVASLNYKVAEAGGTILSQLLTDYQKNSAISSVPQKEETASHAGAPSKAILKSFRQKGLKLFSAKTFLKLWLNS